MEPVGELGVGYKNAFYAVSEAYVGTAEAVAECNLRLEKMKRFIEQQEKLYERR